MGSPSGIWTAVSGGIAQSQNLDTVANNLANVNTTGFKKDTPVFREYLTANERPPSPAIDIPRTIFKDSDFYHFDGREHAFVNVDRIHTDHTQGSLKPTNNPLDFAIEGSGFFAVRTPQGLRFTRAGDFKVNGGGQLVTTDGYPVMALGSEAIAAKATALATLQSNGGVPPAVQPGAPGTPANGANRNPASINPFVEQPGTPPAGRSAGAPPTAPQQALVPLSIKDQLESGQKIHVARDGEVFVGDQSIGSLAVAEFVDARLLKKEASTLYSNPNPANVPRVGVLSQVHQGFLEGSNVNPVSELVELLKANRMFESNMRAIKAYNDMAGKEANEVGKL